MINCIFDPVEFIAEEKYYSKERVCPNCGKKALLNKCFKICPECSRVECEFLMKYIDPKIVETLDRKSKALISYPKPIFSMQILISMKNLVKEILKNLFFI